MVTAPRTARFLLSPPSHLPPNLLPSPRPPAPPAAPLGPPPGAAAPAPGPRPPGRSGLRARQAFGRRQRGGSRSSAEHYCIPDTERSHAPPLPLPSSPSRAPPLPPPAALALPDWLPAGRQPRALLAGWAPAAAPAPRGPAHPVRRTAASPGGFRCAQAPAPSAPSAPSRVPRVPRVPLGEVRRLGSNRLRSG